MTRVAVKKNESSAAPRRRGRPRSDTRLEEVISCASAMFGARGYMSTGLEDIAAQLGMTRAGLYYYTDSKEDLLAKCYQWAHERFLARLDSELGEGTGRELLERFFLIYAEAACDDAARCFFASEDHHLNAEGRKRSAERNHQVNSIVADILRRGAADGSLAVHEQRYVMATLFGAFNSLHRLVRPGSPSPRKMGENVLRIVLDGMLPRP